MSKTSIYCLDCEEKFESELQKLGFDVHSGSLGFKLAAHKQLSLTTPPSEVDFMVFNLTNPNCYNALNAKGLKSSSVEMNEKTKHDMYVLKDKDKEVKFPIFQLIRNNQINTGLSAFTYTDIQKAVSDGGVDLIYYLNPEFLFHAIWELPKLFPIDIKIFFTKVTKYSLSNDVNDWPALKKIGIEELTFKVPIEYKIETSPYQIVYPWFNLITNKVSDCLGAVCKLGKGYVFILPPFLNPSLATAELIKLIPQFKKEYQDNGLSRLGVAANTAVQLILQQNREKKSLTVPIATTQTADYLPKSIFEKMRRDYLLKVVAQINGCYLNGYYDACAAMMRRLVESLIIEIYDTNNRLIDIKANNEIVVLDTLIKRVFDDTALHISRDVKSTLEKIKHIGDTGSHNRKVNLVAPTLDGLKEKFTIAIQELLQNIKF